MTKKLKDLATTIRSKNGGVDHITFDIIFSDRKAYERVRDSRKISLESIAKLYQINSSRMSLALNWEPLALFYLQSNQ